jgi:hypothetical protein
VVAVVEAAAPNVTILGPRIGGQTVVIANPAKPADDHHDQPPEVKVLDHKDFSKQVRMAVIEFSDFWSRGDCVRELERCQAVLISTAPFPDLKALKLKASSRH